MAFVRYGFLKNVKTFDLEFDISWSLIMLMVKLNLIPVVYMVYR